MSFLQKLEIGSRKPIMVRRETLPRLGLGKRLLFASDLHLRKDGPLHVVKGLCDLVSRERPDIVLLGGDLVDWRSGLKPLQHLVKAMSNLAGVAAVAGNHDRWIGLDRVMEAVVAGGGHWLENEPLRLSESAVVYGTPSQSLLSGEFHILCAHHPPATALRRNYQLTLSGHLHGGQFVLYERSGKLYPGAFAYKWNGLRFHEEGNVLLVSRGVHDTLPLRWNCPREVLAVDL